MAVKLDKALKRELEIDGTPYTITIAPDGVSIAAKGHRKSKSLSWKTLLSGDAELARDLNISVDAFGEGARTASGARHAS
ncbi:MAG TPA: hypothetical protein VIG47_05650 [Gemmatimonadaceae bacterium]|jgi:hypothetical protein